MTTPTTPDPTAAEELRQIIRKVLQSGSKNMWRSPDHDQFPQENYEDDLVAALQRSKERAVLEARINALQPYAEQFNAAGSGLEFYWGVRLVKQYKELRAQLSALIGDKTE